jgi:TPR repeat protein
MNILYRLAKLCAILRHSENEPAYYEPLRERDFEAAILPLRESIKREDPVAMTVYAAMLALGRGVDQDFDEAAVWFRQAAIRGHTEGQLALGACLAAGIGTPINDDEAAYWLYQAAKKDHPSAIDLLSTVVWRNQSVIGKHFSGEQFYQIVKKSHRPHGAILH